MKYLRLIYELAFMHERATSDVNTLDGFPSTNEIDFCPSKLARVAFEAHQPDDVHRYWNVPGHMDSDGDCTSNDAGRSLESL